jgi:predicted membrane metal-binding protein
MHAYLSKAGVLAISLSTPGAELRRIMVCRVCPPRARWSVRSQSLAGGAERAIPDDLSLPDFLRRGTTSPRATAEARQSVAELPTYLLFGTTLGPQLPKRQFSPLCA